MATRAANKFRNVATAKNAAPATAPAAVPPAASEPAKTVTQAEIVAAATSIAVSSSAHNLAVELAAVYDTNEELQEALANNFEAIKEGKEGTMWLMRYLKEAYGKAWDKFPWPGSKTGNNPGIITVMKPGRDGADKPTEVSWYSEEFIQTTQVGRALFAKKKAIEAEMADAANTVPLPTLKGELADIVAEINTRVSQIEKAVLLDFLMTAINDCEFVECGFVPDRDGQPRGGWKPMYFCSTIKGETLKQKTMSIGSFLGFDVAAAKAAGGKYDNFLKTLERGAQGGKTRDWSVDTTDNYEALLPEYNGYVRGVLKDDKERASLVSDLKADEAYVDTLIEHHDLVNRLMLLPDIKALVTARLATRKAG